MAQAPVNKDFNLKRIAHAAMGIDESSGPFKSLYQYIDGNLIVSGATQQALDDAIASYNHQAFLNEEINKEVDRKLVLSTEQVMMAVELLVNILATKNVVTSSDIGQSLIDKMQQRIALRNTKV